MAKRSRDHSPKLAPTCSIGSPWTSLMRCSGPSPARGQASAAENVSGTGAGALTPASRWSFAASCSQKPRSWSPISHPDRPLESVTERWWAQTTRRRLLKRGPAFIRSKPIQQAASGSRFRAFVQSERRKGRRWRRRQQVPLVGGNRQDEQGRLAGPASSSAQPFARCSANTSA